MWNTFVFLLADRHIAPLFSHVKGETRFVNYGFGAKVRCARRGLRVSVWRGPTVLRCNGDWECSARECSASRE